VKEPPAQGRGRISVAYGEAVRNTLRDLLDFGAMAERLVARGKDAYDHDETLRLAGEAILHRIGEAVARLPATFTVAHPAVEWRTIKATRNVVAHQSGKIDHEMLWSGLAGKLPETTSYIQGLLDE